MMLMSAPAYAEQVPRLADDAVRAAAQKRLEAFNQALLDNPSATAVLQQWCDANNGASVPRIAARRVRGVQKAADAQVRALLQAAPDEAIAYRRVELVCGERVLSQADNWYRPGRLTAEMNRLLEETDTPFGVAARALGFTRRNLSANLLFRPIDGRGPIKPPREVLRQSALLATPDGAPLSLVVETYTCEVLK